jgi:hypothetical protein
MLCPNVLKDGLKVFMMNYTKHNEDIPLDTILLLLENDYIFESDMLSDTIEFFASHNPCFVYQPDYLFVLNEIEK